MTLACPLADTKAIEVEAPGPIGDRHSSTTPFDMFAAADGYLTIAVSSDTLSRKHCTVPERADWPRILQELEQDSTGH